MHCARPLSVKFYVLVPDSIAQALNFTTPGFLSRVALYDNYTSNYGTEDSDSSQEQPNTIRKSKCIACTPKKIKPLLVPEERVPWEPEKKPVNKRRSRSVPARKILPTIKEQYIPDRPKTTGYDIKQKSGENKILIKKDFSDKYTHNLIITRGCLNLCVKFPPDTTVKFRKGCNEKFINGGLCCCKALSRYNK